MDGHPEVGADTLASALQLHRITALRLLRTRVDQLARVFSHSSLRIPISEELEESLELDAEELPSADVLRRPHREWEPLRTKLGFVYHRLVNTLHAARARARLRRRAGAAARSRARARPPGLAPRGAGLDPAAAVAGRRVRLPPGRDRHPPGRGRRARGDRRAAAGLRRRRRAAPPGAADRGAGLRPARHRARPGRRGGRAAARAGHRRAVRRGLRPAGGAGVRDLDDRAAVGRARRALARAARAARPRCGWCRCSRRARRSRRRRRRWPSCTRASPTSRTCARRPTARR